LKTGARFGGFALEIELNSLADGKGFAHGSELRRLRVEAYREEAKDR
jgi:hypothetical protein